MFPLIFNDLFAQKFQVVQISSRLQKPLHAKLGVWKIVKLLFDNAVTLTAASPASVHFDDGEGCNI